MCSRALKVGSLLLGSADDINLICCRMRGALQSHSGGTIFEPSYLEIATISHFIPQDSKFGFDRICHAAKSARTIWLVWNELSLHFSNKALREKILATSVRLGLKNKLEKGLEDEEENVLSGFRDRDWYRQKFGKPTTRLLNLCIN